MMAQNQAPSSLLGHGTLVLLVGPSGSGKDSLLDFAREHFKGNDQVQFVQRCITRLKEDDTEDHQGMTVAQFQKAEREGQFVISWGAHGLYYGLPASLLEPLEKGGVAVANGSRKTIPVLRDQFPHLKVVNLTVQPDILAQRLASRGRESAEEIEKRLVRTQSLKNQNLFDDDTVHLDNSGELAIAGQEFIEIIKACLPVDAL